MPARSTRDPTPPTPQLLAQLSASGITCTGVGVFPHSNADIQSLVGVARATGGRCYQVEDPEELPQIFIKEALVVRRGLILEEQFTPQMEYRLSEIVKGLAVPLPDLDGYVLTAPKGGLNQVVLKSHQADPICATCQSGLGRCVAFTSSVDSRWASRWLAWGGWGRFWEQTVRWAGRPTQSTDCEIFSDVQGRLATVNVEAAGNLAAAAARAMIAERHGGWVILQSSILGRRAGTGPGVAAYAASKGAVEQLTRELARQWAPYGIRVNAIAPGYFPSEMNAPMVAAPGRLEALISRIPMGRAGEPEDLTGVVAFLASDAARYVTGQILAVDGGMNVW